MASGKTDEMKGRVKEAAGALSGDAKLKREGRIDQTVGKDQMAHPGHQTFLGHRDIADRLATHLLAIGVERHRHRAKIFGL